MAITDLRDTRSDSGDDFDDPPWLPGWARATLLGLAAALVTPAVLVGLAMLAFMVAPLTGTGLPDAVGTGALLALLVNGVSIDLAPGTVSFVPLLLALAPVAAAANTARDVVRRAVADETPEREATLVLRWAPRPIANRLGLWWGGYAVGLALTAALALLGPGRPQWWTLAVPAVVVPAVGVWWALARVERDEPDLLGPGPAAGLLPRVVGDALRPALSGAALLVALGAALVVLAVAMSWGEVSAVHAATGATGLGAVLLTLLQVTALPNLALWGVSLLSGPGFEVVQGATVTLHSTRGGLMPMVPVLAAQPQPGPQPAWALLGVLVPVLVGAWIGRSALGRLPALASMRTKLVGVAVPALLAAGLLGALDAVAGGSFGAYRLSDVGAPALWMTLCLALELTVGALAWLGVDAWRRRR